VRRAVDDAHRVEDAPLVSHHPARFTRGVRDQLHAEVDVELAVYLPLVVLPYGCYLVDAVSAYAVDDVLFSGEELLEEDAFVYDT